MKNLARRRDRYLRDNLAVRLGGVAANLCRIKTFVAHDANQTAVESLVEESKYFIEWTAAETAAATAAELVELQVLLARWQLGLRANWENHGVRARMADDAQRWSERVLQLSGLTSA